MNNTKENDEMTHNETACNNTENINQNNIYDLEFLLDRAYGSFTINTGKIKLVTPICKDENKKTYVVNFPEVCESMNRGSEEIKNFISKELQMDTSIKESGCLKIDGRLKSPKIIEALVRNFVMEHVMCKTCRSCKTRIVKEGRITYMICDARGCKKSI